MMRLVRQSYLIFLAFMPVLFPLSATGSDIPASEFSDLIMLQIPPDTDINVYQDGSVFVDGNQVIDAGDQTSSVIVLKEVSQELRAKCLEKAEAVYQSCVDSGTDEEECQQLSIRAYDLCIKDATRAGADGGFPDNILLNAKGGAVAGVAAQVAAKEIAFEMMLFVFSQGKDKCDAADFGAAWGDIFTPHESCDGLTGTDLTQCKFRNGLRDTVARIYAGIMPAQKNAIWWEVRRQFTEYCKKYSK